MRKRRWGNLALGSRRRLELVSIGVAALLIFSLVFYSGKSGSLAAGFLTLSKSVGSSLESLGEPDQSAMVHLPSAPPAALGAPQPAGTKVYFYGKSLILSKTSDGTVSYYHQDALGSNRIVTDSSGQVASKSVAYPFGEPVEQAGFSTKQSRYTFTGKELDSKLYYYGARYYNPRTARFTAVDPAGGVGSAYGYAAGNPINFVDPDGRQTADAKFSAALELMKTEIDQISQSGFNRLNSGASVILYADPLSGGVLGRYSPGSSVVSLSPNFGPSTLPHELTHAEQYSQSFYGPSYRGILGRQWASHVNSEYGATRVGATVAKNVFGVPMGKLDALDRAALGGRYSFEKAYWEISSWPKAYGELGKVPWKYVPGRILNNPSYALTAAYRGLSTPQGMSAVKSVGYGALAFGVLSIGADIYHGNTGRAAFGEAVLGLGIVSPLSAVGLGMAPLMVKAAPFWGPNTPNGNFMKGTNKI